MTDIESNRMVEGCPGHLRSLEANGSVREKPSTTYYLQSELIYNQLMLTRFQ